MWKTGWRLIQQINCFKTQQFHVTEKEAHRLYFGLAVTAELKMSNWYVSLLVLPLSFPEFLRVMKPRTSGRKIMLYINVMMKNTVFCICITHNRYDIKDISTRNQASDCTSHLQCFLVSVIHQPGLTLSPLYSAKQMV